MSGLVDLSSGPMTELVLSVPPEEFEEGLLEIVGNHSREPFRRWAARMAAIAREVRIAMEVIDRGN